MDRLEKLFGLKGKVAVITGGARGIGKVAAENMAAVGADVVLLDVLEDLAAESAREIAAAHGVRAVSYTCDVTKPEVVAEVIGKAAAEMGTLDLLLNNAGMCLHMDALEVTPNDWLRVVDLNLNGVFYVAQAFARWLIAHDKGGSMVFTASMSADIVNFPQRQASYNATKAAVKHLAKSLAVEWVEKGIRVNSISPGYIWTDMTETVREDYRKTWLDLIPARRMGTPEELAGGIIYLLSDGASYTTGAELVMDGCFTVI